MRQEIISFTKGALLIFLFTMAQSLVGKWMMWSRMMPEGDFALLVLLSFSMGRVRGALLGSLTGVLRDALSSHPFGLGIFVLAGIGFLSGTLAENRRLSKSWQKILFIFIAVLFSDSLLLFLEGGDSLGASSFSRYYLETVFPSATLSTLTGLIIWCFLP